MVSDLLRAETHQQECVPNVLVGESSVKGDLHVHDFRDGVDKLHDILLQHLCRVRELPDVTEAEDSIHLQQAGASRMCTHRDALHHGVLKAAILASDDDDDNEGYLTF